MIRVGFRSNHLSWWFWVLRVKGLVQAKAYWVLRVEVAMH